MGAGARARDALLVGRLLKPGGVVVGPFEEEVAGGRGAPQALLRATRVGDGAAAAFDVHELIPVQFAPLVRPPREARDDDDDDDDVAESDDDEVAAAPPPPPPLVPLKGPRWGDDAPGLFGIEFRVAVRSLQRAATGETSPPIAQLPWHVVETEIVGFLSHDDVHATPPAQPKTDGAPAAPATAPVRLARSVARAVGGLARGAFRAARGLRSEPARGE